MSGHILQVTDSIGLDIGLQTYFDALSLLIHVDWKEGLDHGIGHLIVIR